MAIRINRKRISGLLARYVLRTDKHGRILDCIGINSTKETLMGMYAKTFNDKKAEEITLNIWQDFKDSQITNNSIRHWTVEKQNIDEYLLTSMLFKSYGDKYNKKDNRFA